MCEPRNKKTLSCGCNRESDERHTLLSHSNKNNKTAGLKYSRIDQHRFMTLQLHWKQPIELFTIDFWYIFSENFCCNLSVISNCQCRGDRDLDFLLPIPCAPSSLPFHCSSHLFLCEILPICPGSPNFENPVSCP